MMAKKPDQRPGPLPEIRAEGAGVSFGLEIPGLADGSRLILRCDPDGEVWASILVPPPPAHPFTGGE